MATPSPQANKRREVAPAAQGTHARLHAIWSRHRGHTATSKHTASPQGHCDPQGSVHSRSSPRDLVSAPGAHRADGAQGPRLGPWLLQIRTPQKRKTSVCVCERKRGFAEHLGDQRTERKQIRIKDGKDKNNFSTTPHVSWPEERGESYRFILLGGSLGTHATLQQGEKKETNRHEKRAQQ